MKKHNYILFILLCLTCITFCTCSDDDDPKTYPAPGWTIKDNPEYSVSMTAILQLPENLSVYADQGDELAAFIGDECRGVATHVDNLYYLLIKGAAHEQSKVYFKYYSSKNKYLYKSTNSETFEIDKVYGTADDPKVLSLEIIEE